MRIFIAVGCWILCCVVAMAQRVEYEVSFPNAVHHEAEITAKFISVPSKPLEVRMSRSSPGRYAVHEFAKNVYNVKAFDSKGKQLIISRPNPYQWDIVNHDGTVSVSYTLFGDYPDGTYAGIDPTHAHLNIPATFMWARGLDGSPMTVKFNLPKGSNWKIATQLAPTSDSTTFTAPNLQYFMDCPTELSAHTIRSWEVHSGDKTYTFKLALHHDGSEDYASAYAAVAKAIVLEEKAFFGELPKYDYGQYVFIADYLPYAQGDGMEHRNSTFISSTQSLKGNAIGLAGTLSHEFFHSWNVERMRPKSLEPFNFEEANMSGELWLAEGFTSYYGELALVRAGIVSLDRYVKAIAGAVNYVMNSPGRSFFTPIEMSQQAPFADAAVAIDRNNRSNTFISYYAYGEVIALGLDLTLRSKFSGITLDNFMQKIWELHGKTEKPYTVEDLRLILGTVTKDQAFADDFFRRYINGHEIVDYEKLLSSAGLTLRKEKPNKASLGFAGITYDGGKAIINYGTIVGSPLYKAGLDRGDRIIKIDSVPLTSAKDLDSLVQRHKPGDTVPIEFEQRGVTRTASITFEEARELGIVPVEQIPRPLSKEIIAFREQWLKSKAEGQLPVLNKWCGKCKRPYAFTMEFCSFDGEALQIVQPK
ncbi:MAG: M61 family metallopeptidase [Ignavibacteriales bacterium]|nr:M61 family metallopeptidase [Ignavibacteriales bacterium]